MKEGLLYQKLPGGKVRCGICQRRCLVANNGLGYCQTRLNKDGKIYSLIYGLVSSANIDPIEKKPVYHFQPGSECLSLGTYGCNFRCVFCQNWQITHTNASAINLDQEKLLSPKEAVKMALGSKTQGIAITYNEPAIWLEYCLDVFKLAKKENLYTIWVTNGYGTKESIDIIAPFLDVYRVDLKSFDDKFYQKLINVPQAKPVFETTKYLHQKYPQIHIECVTNIIPGWNDSQKNLKALSSWIVDNLGPETPWHVTRFYPDAELNNVPPTPPKTLFEARKIGLASGLKFVYIGNMNVEKENDTYCPKCQNLAVKRNNYQTEVLGVECDGTCSDCGEDLNIRM